MRAHWPSSETVLSVGFAIEYTVEGVGWDTNLDKWRQRLPWNPQVCTYESKARILRRLHAGHLTTGAVRMDVLVNENHSEGPLRATRRVGRNRGPELLSAHRRSRSVGIPEYRFRTSL